VEQKLVSRSVDRWYCRTSALAVNEAFTVVVAIAATVVMRTNAGIIVRVMARTACMREGVPVVMAVMCVIIQGSKNLKLGLAFYGVASDPVVTQTWLILSFIQILHKQLDDGRLIFRKIDLALGGFLYKVRAVP
jgi:hypothetical protein